MPHHRGSRTRATVGRIAAILLAVTLLAGAGASLAPARAAPAAASATVFLNLSATSLPDFVPSTLQVTPGAPVVLKITQEANFAHTFTLSSVANYTIPASDTNDQLTAFFTLHQPLINLSLGSVPGSVTYANFTAPPVGTYEFVCLSPGHFQLGMHGTLVSGTSGGGGSSSSISPLVLALIAVLVVVVVAIAVVLMVRRRKSPPAATPPPAAKGP